jgi:sugar phosphate isomerase/epimerase
MNKISMGIWGMTNLRDRFNINGFKEEMSVIDRIKLCGQIDDIDGIELHLPTEIDDKNAGEIEKILKDYKLQMVQLCGHTWTEDRFRRGALANVNKNIRNGAIQRVKEALDMGARFNVPISVLWPATDGNDFHLQSNYQSLYQWYVDSVKEIMQYIDDKKYKTKICIEPKPFEPRSYILMGTTAQALCIVNEVNHPGLGINIDIGHSLIAKENIEDQISLIGRYKKLYHTHFDDNDQQADMDVPPGTININRLITIIYLLDEMGYDGWFGLDLFPYRDDTRKFIEVSRDNLRLAQQVVNIMNENGAREMRAAGDKGLELSQLMIKSLQQTV